MFLVCLSCAMTQAEPTTQPADDPEIAYRRSIDKRAGDIVGKLELTDPEKASRVQAIIARQYVDLRDAHAALEIKLAAKPDDSQKQAIQEESQAAIKSLHERYLLRLSNELNAEQIEKVKDGMTYNVVNVTYNAYCEKIPRLTDEQKAYIRATLIEARELAMDGGSSEEKHKIFGKYKGRINNYLSAQGYNLKEEEAAWRERLKAATQPK